MYLALAAGATDAFGLPRRGQMFCSTTTGPRRCWRIAAFNTSVPPPLARWWQGQPWRGCSWTGRAADVPRWLGRGQHPDVCAAGRRHGDSRVKRPADFGSPASWDSTSRTARYGHRPHRGHPRGAESPWGGMHLEVTAQMAAAHRVGLQRPASPIPRGQRSCGIEADLEPLRRGHLRPMLQEVAREGSFLGVPQVDLDGGVLVIGLAKLVSHRVQLSRLHAGVPVCRVQNVSQSDARVCWHIWPVPIVPTAL